MADRTPRLSYQNYVALGPTVIYASSVMPGTSKAWARDPLPTKAWRSATGWNVTASRNDRLDFSEGGVARAASIAVGNYSTGALMAAQLQTALNAAAVSNTYTVGYDPTTHKFAIARATGAATISLLFLTGTNVARSIHHDLGWTDADKTGATLYTAENASYLSREWLKFDLGSALGVDVAFALNNNLTATGTLRIRGNASDAWSSPSASQALSGDARLMAYYFSATQTYQWWELLIDDVQNPAGYSTIAVPYVGSYYQPSRSYRQGMSESNDDLSTIYQTDQGAMFADQKPIRKAWKIVFVRLRKTDKDAFDVLDAFLGLGRPFFCALDPLNYPASETRYMALNSDIDYAHSVGDGTPPDRWTVTLSLIEAVT